MRILWTFNRELQRTLIPLNLFTKWENLYIAGNNIKNFRGRFCPITKCLIICFQGVFILCSFTKYTRARKIVLYVEVFLVTAIAEIDCTAAGWSRGSVSDCDSVSTYSIV